MRQGPMVDRPHSRAPWRSKKVVVMPTKRSTDGEARLGPHRVQRCIAGVLVEPDLPPPPSKKCAVPRGRAYRTKGYRT